MSSHRILDALRKAGIIISLVDDAEQNRLPVERLSEIADAAHVAWDKIDSGDYDEAKDIIATVVTEIMSLAHEFGRDSDHDVIIVHAEDDVMDVDVAEKRMLPDAEPADC